MHAIVVKIALEVLHFRRAEYVGNRILTVVAHEGGTRIGHDFEDQVRHVTAENVAVVPHHDP